ncbi:hypothetical protein [Oceanicaulis sp. MMSF_3324]|uniref:hypothetical protein n=1 Tax=Oceanicaulis sp. MMSF_3324 TaxID=3046702 RepID=UPI00273F6540|nr:hypothetical protein [Oceanicaulis sp. MMSF_3324]
MAAVSASYVSTLYNAGAVASGANKRASLLTSSLGDKPTSEVEDRLSAALEAMKRAPEENRQATRNRARQRVEAVREQLKLIKELYAQNPKEMAKALRHLVKELKSALKAYKEAGGDMQTVGGAGLTAPAAAPAPSETRTAPADDALSAETDSEQDATTVAAEVEAEEAARATDPMAGPASAPEPARASLDDLEARLGALMGDEAFVQSVDGLKRKIKELFETARIQSAFLERDKARDSAFETLDKALKTLDEDVTDYTRDVQDELIGVRLQIKMIERGELSAPAGLDVTA